MSIFVFDEKYWYTGNFCWSDINQFFGLRFVSLNYNSIEILFESVRTCDEILIPLLNLIQNLRFLDNTLKIPFRNRFYLTPNLKPLTQEKLLTVWRTVLMVRFSRVMLLTCNQHCKNSAETFGAVITDISVFENSKMMT